MAGVSSSAPINALSETAESDGYTRLHITPLDKELISVVLSSTLLPKARNISYHTIATFPEKRYGYVDLPTMEADKLKKKLNGALLKGTKLRVDVARPETITEATAAEDEVRLH